MKIKIISAAEIAQTFRTKGITTLSQVRDLGGVFSSRNEVRFYLFGRMFKASTSTVLNGGVEVKELDMRQALSA